MSLNKLLTATNVHFLPIEEDVYLVEATAPDGEVYRIGFFNGMPLQEFSESLTSLVAGVVKGSSQ